MENLFDSTVNFYAKVGANGVFAICIIISSALFFMALLKSLFKRGYGAKKKLNYLSFIFGISLLQLGVVLLSNEGAGFCVLTLGYGVITFALLTSIRVKEKTRKEQRELVKFIDERISGQIKPQKNQINAENIERFDTSPNFLSEEKVPIAFENKTKEPYKKPIDIDFTHVKNVLERLEYFTLSPTDRRQVKELQTAVINAERGELTDDIKIKINDGLSALLKIMAKYGI